MLTYMAHYIVMRKAWNKLNLIGQEFSRLKVISEFGRDHKMKVIWLCQCKCGEKVAVRSESLRSGNTKSCGCMAIENLVERNTVHGLSKKPEYKIWVGIIKRCFNKKSAAYPNYGGRGISVCEKWRSDFVEFYKDIGERPSNKHEIERIDNDGNYEPLNCKWATRHEQQQNKCTSKEWTVFGVRYSEATEAAELHNVTVSTIHHWCQGYVSRGKRYPPKQGCFSARKYEH